MRNGILFFLLLLFSVCMYAFGIQESFDFSRPTAVISLQESTTVSQYRQPY